MLISWLAMNVPWVSGYRLRLTQQRAQVDDPPEALNDSSHSWSFLKHLPEAVQGELISLKSELHCIEVTTETGQALILYHLKDALQEISSAVGIQTHRSYWVSWGYIKSVRKQGRQGTVTWVNGFQIPVSRNRWSVVKEACANRNIPLN